MSALSELLLQHLPAGWSARRVAREAQKLGLTLKESTATAYFGSRHGANPSEPVLQALAEVLDIPIEEVRRAAGLPVGEHLPYEPPAEAARLSQRQRAAFDELIRAVVATTTKENRREAPEPQQGQGNPPVGSEGRTGAPIAGGVTPPEDEVPWAPEIPTVTDDPLTGESRKRTGAG